MKNVYFRVHNDAESGLGHLSRSLKLYNKIKRKFKTKFYLDYKNNQNPFTEKFNYLYKKKKNYNEKNDVKVFLSKIKKPSIIVVDDYRAKKLWFNEVKKKHSLVIFDDLNKFPLNADIIINTKVNFLDKENIKKVFKKNQKSKILLGPRYALLEKKKNNIIKNNNSFNIFFYASEQEIFLKLISIGKLLAIFFKKEKIDYNFFFSSGSLKIKTENIYKPFFKDKKHKFIFGKDINKNYNVFNLYVGSAGLNFFEMTQYNVPGLFFETAKNQEIDLNCADLFNQFFILKIKEIYNEKKILDLILLMKKNIKLLKKYLVNSKFKPDHYGSERIEKEILLLNENL